MPASAAIRTVVIRIVNVGQAGGFERGEFHRRTLPLRGCGSLLYNSYSREAAYELYTCAPHLKA